MCDYERDGHSSPIASIGQCHSLAIYINVCPDAANCPKCYFFIIDAEKANAYLFFLILTFKAKYVVTVVIWFQVK